MLTPEDMAQAARVATNPAAAAGWARAAKWVAYRGWWINYAPPPIPVRSCDWEFWHDDYDGAEDANDNRCGHAASLEAAKAEIDFWHEEQGQ